MKKKKLNRKLFLKKSNVSNLATIQGGRLVSKPECQTLNHSCAPER